MTPSPIADERGGAASFGGDGRRTARVRPWSDRDAAFELGVVPLQLRLALRASISILKFVGERNARPSARSARERGPSPGDDGRRKLMRAAAVRGPPQKMISIHQVRGAQARMKATKGGRSGAERDIGETQRRSADGTQGRRRRRPDAEVRRGCGAEPWAVVRCRGVPTGVAVGGCEEASRSSSIRSPTRPGGQTDEPTGDEPFELAGGARGQRGVREASRRFGGMESGGAKRRRPKREQALYVLEIVAAVTTSASLLLFAECPLGRTGLVKSPPVCD